MNMNDRNGISVIVPFLNEEKGLEKFCKTIDDYAATLEFLLEIIFVDDGSLDSSANIIERFSFRNINRVKLVKLSRNFGSHAAIRAGLQYASFGISAWLGSDLQEPLELLEQSYQKICDGYDAVYIEKRSIKISKTSRMFSKIYSWLVRKYAVENYKSGGICTIVFDEKVRTYLNENIENNSSIILQVMNAGFKNIVLSMDFNERSAGKSKWTLSKKIKLFIDSFVAFSFMPIRLVSIIGVLIFIVGLIIGIMTIINKLTSPSVPVGYSTLASIMALGFGITNISLGIIAEYLWRTYDAARKRPVYIVSEIEILKAG